MHGLVMCDVGICGGRKHRCVMLVLPHPVALRRLKCTVIVPHCCQPIRKSIGNVFDIIPAYQLYRTALGFHFKL